jgi:hypothetical protein
MADIRFKISGNTPTFLAKLYNSTHNVVIQQKEVNYSGTTVIFGGLPPSTCYYIYVYDSAGNLATGSTLTSNCSIGTTTLATKSIYMGGNVCKDSLYPYTSYVNCVGSNGNNKINVSPALSQGESVNLIFTLNMENTTNCNQS